MHTEEDKAEVQETTIQPSNKNNEELRKKLLLFGGIGVGIVVLIVIIISIVNMITGRRMSYTAVEQKMKEAAESYYKENKNLLPTHDGEVTVDATTLSTGKFMRPLEKIVPKGASCTGKVVVKENGDTYSYTAYLDCGESYHTTELYKKLIDSANIVTTGDGLYQMNHEYVFRGENVNNYLKIGNNIWRIIKVNSSNEVQLILTNSKLKSVWDDRYNTQRQYNVGINEFTVSRIRTYLNDLYQNNEMFDNSIKEKLSIMDACYARRDEKNNVNDGSVECTSKISDTKISLLPIYDYINASLDSTCKTPGNPQCQNYNYLATEQSSWWTITGVTENTYRVYSISYSGEIGQSQASNNNFVRPVIQLSNTTMYSSGDGTAQNPYVIR